jgi:Na+-translocating ferredoxin:NAD+ oxidoreductase RnfG subunit
LNQALPILDADPSPEVRRVARLSVFVHLCRAGLFLGIIFLIRKQHNDLTARQTSGDRLNVVTLASIKDAIPIASVIGPWDETGNARAILSEQGNQVGKLIQTAPIGNQAIGYLGPTNLLVLLSDEQRILKVEILESADTLEHVNAVIDSPFFLPSYSGLRWGFPGIWPEVDSVSGATLTSYAIKQAIQARAGSQTRLSKFTDPILGKELVPLFPGQGDLDLQFSALKPELSYASILDETNATVGYLVRSSPTSDSLSGYQGPTDTLIIFDENYHFMGSLIRSSYDNEPYVRYVKEDSYLNDTMRGKSLDEIAEYDGAQYEGVSGATMTSLNVLDGIQTTARHIRKNQTSDTSYRQWLWIAFECLTSLICLAGILLSFTTFKQSTGFRVSFQVILIVYLGFISGEVLSQAVISGWAQNGLPLKNAPGMVFLCLAAVTVPVISKYNTYCDHICPFGAIQQLSKKSKLNKFRVNRHVGRCLKMVPAAILGLVLVAALGQLDLNLAAIEPFDAFSFRVAGWLTIAIALTGMIASFFVPMAYCRFGCPTGTLLSFLRFNRQSHMIHPRDCVAVVMLLVALLISG